MTPDTPPSDFVRAITRIDAVALVVGSMVGSGIFIVSADIARQVGAPGPLLLVWLLAGVVTLMGALTYGELAAQFPKAGGQYVYLREAISPLLGFLYGWTLFAVIQTGTIAAVAVGFARFTSVFVPALSAQTFFGVELSLPSGPIEVGLSPQRLLAVASVLVLTWINIRGVRVAALIQTWLSSIKILSLLMLIGLGVALGYRADALAAEISGAFWPAQAFEIDTLALLGAAMVGALFAMDAWNNVGFAADELRDPRRDLPFAMLGGVSIVVALYVAANVAYLFVLPFDAIATAPEDRVATAVLQAMLGEPGLYVMAGAIMISAIGCNNGLILSGARVYYAMARDGLFFRKAELLHPTYKTPAFGLLAQAAWTSVLCISGTYSQLLDYVVFAALMFYGVTAVGVFVLRVKRPDLARPVRVPLFPWLPAAYVVVTAALCVNLLIEKPQYSWPGLAIVVLGIPVYGFWRWWGGRQTANL